MPKSEQQKILDDFLKNPQAHPLSQEKIVIHLSLPKLMDDAKITNKPFFDTVFVAFAHEMQHILDMRIPRMGAMGPQVTEIDATTYVSVDTNNTEYHKTARELSAYEVTNEMLVRLSKQKL